MTLNQNSTSYQEQYILYIRLTALKLRTHLTRFADAQTGRLGQVARYALVPLLLDILGTRRGFHAHGGADGGGDARGLQRGLALRVPAEGWFQMGSDGFRRVHTQDGGPKKVGEIH
jgi:hypothetical protein